MTGKLYTVFTAFCFVALNGGCEPANTEIGKSRPVAKASVDPQEKQVNDPESEMPPRYLEMELFVNNRKHGETNGCTTGFTVHPKSLGMQVAHEMTCGHPGAVSKVVWRYIESDDRGDHYDVRRVFPLGESNETAKDVRIVFNGQPIVLFEDDVQLVTMRSSKSR